MSVTKDPIISVKSMVVKHVNVRYLLRERVERGIFLQYIGLKTGEP